MPWWGWLCLGISGALLVAGLAVLVAALIGLGRASKRLQASLRPAVEEMQRSAAALQVRNEGFALRQGRLQEKLTRAQTSYGDLLVLWEALAEVRMGIRVLRLVLARR